MKLCPQPILILVSVWNVYGTRGRLRGAGPFRMRASGIVLAAVTGAKPAAELTARLGRLDAGGNAAEMGADGAGDEPLFMARLDPLRVGRRIAQLAQRHGLGFLDLGLRCGGARTPAGRARTTMMPEPSGIGDRSTSSSDKGQHVLGRVHAVDQRPCDRTGPDSRRGAGDQLQEVPFGDVRPRAVGGCMSGRRHRIGHPCLLAACRKLHGQVAAFARHARTPPRRTRGRRTSWAAHLAQTPQRVHRPDFAAAT